MYAACISAAECVAAVFAADFASGLVHWLEDAYVRDGTPLVGRPLGRPNMVHHHYPRYMTRNTWWQSSWDLIGLAAAVVAAAWCVGLLTWQVWLFAIVGANANESHKWGHRTRRENGPVVTFFQGVGLLQSARHHARHHRGAKNTHYCTITPYVNPALDAIRFWTGLEWLLAKTVGLTRRPDTSIRGQGLGPEWLKAYAAPVRHSNRRIG